MASSSWAGTRTCRWSCRASSSSLPPISTSSGARPMPADIMHADDVGSAALKSAGPALEMNGIGKRFPGVLALENVDVALQPGKVHALMGENGAGKSTLIKIMAGVYQRDSGTMRVGGRE